MNAISQSTSAQDFINHIEALREERDDIQQQIRSLEADLQRVSLDLQSAWSNQTFDALACDMVDLDGVEPASVPAAIDEIKHALGG